MFYRWFCKPSWRLHYKSFCLKICSTYRRYSCNTRHISLWWLKKPTPLFWKLTWITNFQLEQNSKIAYCCTKWHSNISEMTFWLVQKENYVAHKRVAEIKCFRVVLWLLMLWQNLIAILLDKIECYQASASILSTIPSILDNSNSYLEITNKNIIIKRKLTEHRIDLFWRCYKNHVVFVIVYREGRFSIAIKLE